MANIRYNVDSSSHYNGEVSGNYRLRHRPREKIKQINLRGERRCAILGGVEAGGKQFVTWLIR